MTRETKQMSRGAIIYIYEYFTWNNHTITIIICVPVNLFPHLTVVSLLTIVFDQLISRHKSWVFCANVSPIENSKTRILLKILSWIISYPYWLPINWKCKTRTTDVLRLSGVLPVSEKWKRNLSPQARYE